MSASERDFGRVEGEMHSMQRDLEQIRQTVSDLRKDVSEVKETLAQVAGAWKVAVWVAGVLGAVLGFLLKAWVGKGVNV